MRYQFISSGKSINMELLLSLLITLFVTEQTPSPKQVADELLAADRAFAAAASKTDLITAISSMFASDVAMPTPTGIAYGADKAIEALKSNPANIGARIEWTPARVAISGDGTHGYTAGFMKVSRADGGVQAAKYMTYWGRQSAGWRALAYKRAPAKVTAAVTTVAYVLPKQITPSSSGTAAIERDRESLAEAERSFSRDAQTMGIGAAFKLYGSPDAANFGGPDVETFVLGNEAIGEAVGRGSPANSSPVKWGPEKTIIASSGDFGVTLGYIVRNAPGPDGKISPGQPFFTIWKRESPPAPWRYIAE